MFSQRFLRYFQELLRSGFMKYRNYPLDKRGNLNVHKTFRGRPARLLKVPLILCIQGGIPCSKNTLKQPENDWTNVKKQLQVNKNIQGTKTYITTPLNVNK